MPNQLSFTDNNLNSRELTKYMVFHTETEKHVQVIHHYFVREKVIEGAIENKNGAKPFTHFD